MKTINPNLGSQDPFQKSIEEDDMVTTISDGITHPFGKTVGKNLADKLNTSKKISRHLMRNMSFNSMKRMTQTTFAIEKALFRWMRNRQQPMPILLRDTMQELGTTYIKLGQLVASSPSLFPHEYVEAFQSFLDNTTPVPFKVIEKTLRQELGNDYHRFFRHIDPEPLASASIAQVHAATWQNGDEVVIKVQKPGVETTLETDFQFMALSAKLAELLVPNMPKGSLSDMVEEIRNGMMDECDFYKEARNIHSYENFLREANITEVVVPKVYLQATRKRVLTMERFYGAPLSDIEQVKRYSQNPEETLIHALNTWFRSLTHCQIYHADLHAGNVMVLKDGRVGFIDFGIVGKITKPTWEALMNLTVAIPAKDYFGIAKSLIAIGATDKNVNAANFARDIEALVVSLQADNSVNVTHDDYTTYVNPDQYIRHFTLQLSSISKKHGIRFPREFTLLIKQFLYFDRYVRLLAPDLEMFGDDRVLLRTV
jgi:predicted unusual protein kinase regulating ubiquinone biosynthesis (AarF/ABC1/UbiB family)